MKKSEIKTFRGYVRYQIYRLFTPFRWLWKTFVRLTSRYQRLMQLRRIANLKPNAVESLSQDETALLHYMSEYLIPSRWVTRKGHIIYTCPSVDEVTLWQMIEARQAETAIDRITGWTGGYAPETVADMIKLTKYIAEQIEQADQLERMLLPGAGKGGESNPIEEAKSVLGMVQIAAELFHCSFEEAKKIDYSDVILAISKRHEEVEKQKSKTK